MLKFIHLEKANINEQTKIGPLTPEEALAELKDGNRRFTHGQNMPRELLDQVHRTGKSQTPFAIVLGCIDSRVPPEIVFDQGIGDIFSARIAGNFINDDILGSMEFATKMAGAKLILVLGHSRCGAIMGAADDAQLGNLTGMLTKLKPAVETVRDIEGPRSSENVEFIDAITQKNVEMTVQAIKERSPVLEEMLEAGEIMLAGAIYDVASGKVDFLK
ncbi:MAG: carbonic anhydrase family protein [Anaerolineales bacterium]